MNDEQINEYISIFKNVCLPKGISKGWIIMQNYHVNCLENSLPVWRMMFWGRKITHKQASPAWEPTLGISLVQMVYMYL